MKKIITFLTVMLLIGTSTTGQIPTAGLVAWYPFNGNANDLSGNGNNGTVNGATLTTDRFGNTNSAYSFNGSSNYIYVNASSSINTANQTATSICGWIKTTAVQTSHQMVFMGGDFTVPSYECYAATNQPFQARNYIWQQTWGICNSISTSSPGIWSFAVMVYDFQNSKLLIYVNGVFENQVSWSITRPNNPHIEMGRNPWPESYVNGVLDDIRIYNRVLTPTEITEIYNENSNSTPTTQATNITFSNIQTNQFSSNWTDGNGSKRAVFIKQDSVGTATPINSTTYTANTAFGSGSQIGTSGWYCVFNSTTHSGGISITNLLPNTKYRVMVCEYNGTAGTEQYNITSANNNPNNQKTCDGTVPTNGLLAWYSFNGNANDGSGNGNNGTVNGATLTTDRFGNPNSAYSFNGISDFIVINNTTLANFGTSNFTIAGWVNPSYLTTPGTSAIFCKRNTGVYGNFVEFDINNWKIKGEIDESSSGNYSVVASTTSVGLNTWYFGVFVRESNIIRMYFNGNLEGTTTTPIIQNINNTGQATIGDLSGGGGYASLNGKIDDIRVYNRALSSCEIMALYNETSTNLIPTVQATNVVFTNISTNQFSTNWTDGNGTNRAVFIKQDSVGTAVPITNTTYSANTAFGSGSQIGTSGWYCIFNGTSHTGGVTITNLLPNTKYRVMVCEYNGGAGAEQYNISSANNNPNNQKTCDNSFPLNGLVAWYPFNGDAIDASGNGNNGTVHGATLTTDRFGNANAAYYFNGTTDYISVNNSPSLNPTDEISISAWVKWETGGANDYFILSKQYELSRSILLKFRPHIIVSGTPVIFDGQTSIPSGVWTFVTMVYDGSAVKVFFNSTLDGFVNQTGTIQSSSDPLIIGQRVPASGGMYQFKGSIDDIRIYNQALTDCEIAALYQEQESFNINLTSNPTLGGSVIGSGTYMNNTPIVVSATPNAGYIFSNWTENGNVVSNTPDYPFTVTSNRDLVANFTLQQFIITTSYTPSGSGSTSGGGSFNYGTNVTVRASANSGWVFNYWSENDTLVSTSSSYSFIVSENRNLVANFIQQGLQYTVTANPNPVNAGSTIGGGVYNSGYLVTVEAFANSGWAFVNWTEFGSQVSTNSSYSFSIIGNRDLVANFVQGFTITAIATPANAGYTSGGGVYTSGQIATVQAFSNNGWSFYNWTENGSTVSTNPSYSFTVSNNRSLNANFLSTVGTDESVIAGIQIYPNPTKGTVIIHSETPIEQIVVYNSMGVQVVRQYVNNSGFTLDLTQFSKGVYFIRMTIGEKNMIQKIILL
jgi:hypothetical protein